MGRFLSAVDMASAKRESEIFNSRLKRGGVKHPETIKRSLHVVCGCGAEGCIFISHDRRDEQGNQLQAYYS